ncbi:MAG: twin-arginine translocase TatA/TatE family subunit [Acidimicrobiales bacterium]
MVLANLAGPDTIILVVVVALVFLFGGSQLPKLARGLGSASHEFRKGLEEGSQDAAAKEGDASGTGKSDSAG